MSDKKYYKVTCKCGHAGSRNKCLFIEFPICAENGKQAAEIGRRMPRCKHHHPDAIREVVEISFEEYNHIREVNKMDPYLHCKCIQDQSEEMIEGRVQEDEYILSLREHSRRREQSRKMMFSGKERIRNPKIYYRNNPVITMEEE